MSWYQGGMTFKAMTDRLNGDGHTTRRQKSWNHAQVARVLRRAGIALRSRGRVLDRGIVDS